MNKQQNNSKKQTEDFIAKALTDLEGQHLAYLALKEAEAKYELAVTSLETVLRGYFQTYGKVESTRLAIGLEGVSPEFKGNLLKWFNGDKVSDD